MNISNMINILQHARKRWGDLPVTTFDGDVYSVLVHPCKDGIQSRFDGVQDEKNINEISVEICSK